MPRFSSGPGGINLEDGFLTESEILETFVGNQAYVCGDNAYGQIGANAAAGLYANLTQTVSGGTNWKQPAGGTFFNAAIKTDGTLWTWGRNSYGQLGINAITHRSSPVQTVAGGTNWDYVTAKSSNIAAIKTDGTLWLWGRNTFGQLGINNIVHRSSPVQTVSLGTNWKTVACGQAHTAAIKTDGTLWIWGNNSNGQLGINNIVHRSSPVQTISTGTNWKQVDCGNLHTAAIKTDGTLWTWGNSTSGQTGRNDFVHRSSPIQTISGGTNWKYLSCGANHVVTIKTDGTLWTWGSNYYGQLGIGSNSDRSSPVQTVSGGTNWKYISSTYLSTMAIKTDGTLWGWGHNYSGQLGNGGSSNLNSPVRSDNGTTNWKLVASGDYNSVAITFTES